MEQTPFVSRTDQYRIANDWRYNTSPHISPKSLNAHWTTDKHTWLQAASTSSLTYKLTACSKDLYALQKRYDSWKSINTSVYYHLVTNQFMIISLWLPSMCHILFDVIFLSSILWSNRERGISERMCPLLPHHWGAPGWNQAVLRLTFIISAAKLFQMVHL